MDAEYATRWELANVGKALVAMDEALQEVEAKVENIPDPSPAPLVLSSVSLTLSIVAVFVAVLGRKSNAPDES